MLRPRRVLVRDEADVAKFFHQPRSPPAKTERSEGRFFVDQHRRRDPFMVDDEAQTNVFRSLVGTVVETRTVPQDTAAFRATLDETGILSNTHEHASRFHAHTAGSSDHIAEGNINGVSRQIHVGIPMDVRTVICSALSTVMSDALPAGKVPSPPPWEGLLIGRASQMLMRQRPVGSAI